MGPIYTIFFALHSSPICLFIGSVIFPQALTDHDAHELPNQPEGLPGWNELAKTDRTQKLSQFAPAVWAVGGCY